MFLMLSNLRYRAFCLVIVLSLPSTLLAETVLYKYAINLSSAQSKHINLIDLKEFDIDKKYKIYQSEVKLGRGKSFYRLRIGFFKSKKEANKVASKFKSKYSKLWIDRLHKQDRKILSAWLTSLSVRPKSDAVTRTNAANLSSKDKEIKANKLMIRADQAMKDKSYRLAVSLYTKIIFLKNSSKHQQAMEFLGVAREKNGQLIHARAEYRLYLKKYTKGEDTSRVRQRLLSLETLLLKPKRRLKGLRQKQSDGRLFGSVLQFYRKDVFSSNQSTTANESLSTVVNLLYRKRTDSLNIKSQFNANHVKYINNTLKKDKEIINILFVDVADVSNTKSIRLGRQSQNKGGVLGRMDGAWFSYRLNPTWKLNMVAGYPVQTTISNVAQTNRPFIGISADIGTIAKYWNFNIYTISQEIDSIVDREAIGGEIRYRKGKQNHFLLVDYDTHFSVLNTFFYLGNWLFDNKTSINLSVSRRNSPILTTINATQGQTTQSIEALLQTYTESELYQIAKDRTSIYDSVAISSTIYLSDEWSFVGDVTMSNLSSTPTSAGVPAIDGTGDEYFYNAQLVGYNVFGVNETSRFQVLLDDTKTFTRTQLIASTRFRLKNKKWRLRPQITFENRDNSNGGKTNKIKTELKVDYKIKRQFKLELDISYEVGKTTFPVSINENNYYISAGYVWDF